MSGAAECGGACVGVQGAGATWEGPQANFTDRTPLLVAF